MRLLFLLVVLLLGGAAPAGAHDVSEHGAPGVASDLRSAVVSATLPGGVTLDVLGNGQALLLRNGSAGPVTVVTSGGSKRMAVPAGGLLQWHENAAHPDPSAVGRDHPVQRWQVELLAGGQRYEVIGEVRWAPGPSPWPWLAAAALVAIAAAGGAGLRPTGAAGGVRQRLAVVLGLAVTASVSHTAAALAARTAEGSRWSLLGDYLPQAGCWALGAVAAVLLARDQRDGPWLGALASAGLLLVSATTATPVLSSSTVLVALPATLDRLLVIAVLGLAVGHLLAISCAAAVPRRT